MLNKQQEGQQEEKHEKSEAKYNQVLMVENHQGMDRTSLYDKNMTQYPRVPLDKDEYFKVNSIPLIDEYAVEKSQEEVDMDNESIVEIEDDDDISKM